jgi:hypothetical protein
MASTDEKKLYEFSEQYLVKCPKIWKLIWHIIVIL